MSTPGAEVSTLGSEVSTPGNWSVDTWNWSVDTWRWSVDTWTVTASFLGCRTSPTCFQTVIFSSLTAINGHLSVGRLYKHQKSIGEVILWWDFWIFFKDSRVEWFKPSSFQVSKRAFKVYIYKHQSKASSTWRQDLHQQSRASKRYLLYFRKLLLYSFILALTLFYLRFLVSLGKPKRFLVSLENQSGCWWALKPTRILLVSPKPKQVV